MFRRQRLHIGHDIAQILGTPIAPCRHRGPCDAVPESRAYAPVGVQMGLKVCRTRQQRDSGGAVAGIGFFALSFVVLGVIPGMHVQREIARAAPSTMQPLTVQQEWGRRIYGSMGCGYCHTLTRNRCDLPIRT